MKSREELLNQPPFEVAWQEWLERHPDPERTFEQTEVQRLYAEYWWHKGAQRGAVEVADKVKEMFTT